jgi:hypothetical protein
MVSIEAMASVTTATVIGAAMTGVRAATGIAIAGAMAAGDIPMPRAASMTAAMTVCATERGMIAATTGVMTAATIAVMTIATIVTDLQIT